MKTRPLKCALKAVKNAHDVVAHAQIYYEKTKACETLMAMQAALTRYEVILKVLCEDFESDQTAVKG